MTPTQFFISQVNQIQVQTKVSYTEAWRLAAQQHSEVGTLMGAFGKSGQQVQFFNERVLTAPAPASRAAAREVFQAEVKALMDKGQTYETAFNNVQRTAAFANSIDPSIDRALQHLRDISAGAAFVNDAVARSATGHCPVAAPQLKAAFRLPIDASQEEFEAAWAGNGSTVVPMNPGKIFAGLVEFTQNSKALDYESAVRTAKSRYPVLWDLCEAIAKA